MVDGHVQCLRDVVEPLVEHPMFSMFDVDQNVPGDTRLEGECLLVSPLRYVVRSHLFRDDDISGPSDPRVSAKISRTCGVPCRWTNRKAVCPFDVLKLSS
jgi:hypothetical protein